VFCCQSAAPRTWNRYLTYRENSHIGELPDETRHGIDVVVDAPEQDGLVTNHDTSLKKLLASLFGDPRDLVGMVEMRMKGHGFASLLGLVGDGNHGIDPLVV